VSHGSEGGDFAKFWGGAGFMRENKRCSFREVEDGFNVVMEKGDGCCSFVYLEELGYYISYACPFFSIRE
jgi:hypothetical protein